MGTETTAIQIVQPQEASMSLKQVSDRVNLVHQVLEKVMRRGTHYGTVPGCGDKKVLLKPGADVLAMTFRLVPRFSVVRTELPNEHREYDVICTMHAADGSMLGQGVGSCTTMERRYRYRKDASGAKIENEDIADVYNTVLKMARKRAHVDATLTVTGAADLFTQDLVEDEDDAPPRPPVAMPTPKPPPARPQPSPAMPPVHNAAAPTDGMGPLGETRPAAPPPERQTNPDEQSSCTVIGKIEKEAKPKTGTSKDGKPWTKYGFLVQGEWYGTFSETLAATVREFFSEGITARITWEAKGEYRTLTDIQQTAAAEGANA